MSTPLVLREWASNTNYVAGPDVGTPTKVDPGSALSAEGFEPGPIDAQHVNFILNATGRAAKTALRTTLCRPLTLSQAPAAGTNMTAVATQKGYPVLLMGHSTAVYQVGACDPISATGSLTSITSASSAAYNPTAHRVVVSGPGGNKNCYSDDYGATWTAGGSLGGQSGLIWVAPKSKFLAVYTDHVANSADATAWTAVSVTNARVGTGIAQFSDGSVLVFASVGPGVIFTQSTNGGGTWTATSTVPNPGDFALIGNLAGSGADYVYHQGKRNSGVIQISRCAFAGGPWTDISYISPPAGTTFNNGGTILQCPDTGVLWFLSNISTLGVVIYASVDQGQTWTDPMLTGVAASPAVELMLLPGDAAAAGGRLFLLTSQAATPQFLATIGFGNV